MVPGRGDLLPAVNTWREALTLFRVGSFLAFTVRLNFCTLCCLRLPWRTASTTFSSLHYVDGLDVAILCWKEEELISCRCGSSCAQFRSERFWRAMERLPGWAVCQGIFATFPPPLSSPELGAIVNHDTILNPHIVVCVNIV